MERSQYLAQAIQAMGAPQAQPPPQGMSMAQMQQVGDQRKAFEQANPGQSYMAHGFKQMGQNIQQAPANLMAAPGNAMDGLSQLAKRFQAPR